ncbi:hypothetical protein LSH36_52g03004 [Paralvinella palmiformis]|uniref:DUF4200 domain-containing protein n=1 Tax=Paralvinella palmiformis TaxID=53620 RepID=A0AAD9K6F9_9ANNE|nr:hypothetical protein LSH36_52g03004 [Paralvinella palmiformis]
MGDKSPHSRNASVTPSEMSGKKSRNELVSRQSGKVTFPNSARSGSGGSQRLLKSSNSAEDYDPNVNPFKMPPDNDIFLLRDKERQKKKQSRLMRRKDDSDDDGHVVNVKDDPQFTLAVTRDRHVEKESLADYISKKREMFLVQYSLGVKRDEMRKLEEIARAEEEKLAKAEQYLEEDAAMFDEFLKENDKNSVEAIKIAEAETKAKLEKVAEIKRINAQMMAIKSEISKHEDILKEYMLYKKFLERLTPKNWLEERREKKRKRLEEKRKQQAQNAREAQTPSTSEKSRKGKSLGTSKAATKASLADNESMSSMTDSDDDSDDEPELYFTDPQQLLDIFAELEEQNLSLIQNSQETEEALEEMKQTIKNTKKKMENETLILKEQILKLTTSIEKEEEKGRDLELKAKMFSHGKFQAEEQAKMLTDLNKRVEDVYRSTIGDNEANISTLQMLTNIENRLEELFEQIEMMPQDKVEAAEKAKEKERRLKLREEKMEQQRLHQEERVRRALERAKAEPKKKIGRKLVARSEPPTLRKREDDGADQASREEEELAYFFTP